MSSKLDKITLGNKVMVKSIKIKFVKELALVKALIKVSDEKGLYSTEEALLKKLKR